MTQPRASATATLIDAMRILSRDIRGGDGVANAAILEASTRLQQQQLLLRLCWPHIQASHGATHMLDGFKPKPRPEIDHLYQAMKQAVEQ